MTGADNNVLTLNRLDVLDISTQSNRLTVLGNAGDTVSLVEVWRRGVKGGLYDLEARHGNLEDRGRADVLLP